MNNPKAGSRKRQGAGARRKVVGSIERQEFGVVFFVKIMATKRNDSSLFPTELLLWRLVKTFMLLKVKYSFQFQYGNFPAIPF